MRETHESVEKGRLLTLLTQSVQYQAQNGFIKPNIGLSLFENRQK